MRYLIGQSYLVEVDTENELDDLVESMEASVRLNVAAELEKAGVSEAISPVAFLGTTALKVD